MRHDDLGERTKEPYYTIIYYYDDADEAMMSTIK
jgi:hypothetical protein